MSLPLAGRVAVITGVSRRVGIGFAVARELARLGADLFIHSFSHFDAAQPWGADPGGIDGIISDLRATGRQIDHMSADFREPDAAGHVMQAAVSTFGHVDILDANHAYSTSGSLEQLLAEDVDIHLQVNVRGSLMLIKHFAAQHDGRPGGRIFLITSGQHLHPMPDELAYIASKGALHQLTTTLAADLAPRNITVNTINPGATDTGYASGELYERVRRANPRGRWGEPQDVARLIAWLSTDDGEWVTGQIINSTGGGI